jgi:hypothetical protein
MENYSGLSRLDFLSHLSRDHTYMSHEWARSHYMGLSAEPEFFRTRIPRLAIARAIEYGKELNKADFVYIAIGILNLTR